MKNYFTFLLILFLTVKGSAQQDALFSQYMFNPFVLNPAYAGSRDVAGAVLTGRAQWVEYSGTPRTAGLSVNTPLGSRNGVGFQLFSDNLGPHSSLTYLASYSYKLPLFKGKLSMGLRGGGITYNMNWNKIDYKDFEPVSNYSFESFSAFNGDFGLFYFTRKFYAGLSANHIVNNLQITSIDNGNGEDFLKTHLFFTTGYTFEVKENIAIQPSLLLRSAQNTPFSFDLNCNLLLYKRFWIGGSVRPEQQVVILAQAFINEKLRAGYSFDLSLSKKYSYGGTSHEVFIGYDFLTSKKKVVHPRYF